MLENLSLWNQVEKTDTKSTKSVSFGRKFTAIDAIYQIKKASEMFGTMGVGFGVRNEKWDFKDVGSHEVLFYFADFWYIWLDKEGVIPMVSSIELIDKKKKFDDEACKKTQTDALTKVLSKLGFNADVFMGKFDDNKYVMELKKEEAEKEAEEKANKKPTSLSSKLVTKLKEAKITDMRDFARVFDISSSDITSLQKYFGEDNLIDVIIPFYTISKSYEVEDVKGLISIGKLESARMKELVKDYTEFKDKNKTDFVELIELYKTKG